MARQARGGERPARLRAPCSVRLRRGHGPAPPHARHTWSGPQPCWGSSQTSPGSRLPLPQMETGTSRRTADRADKSAVARSRPPGDRRPHRSRRCRCRRSAAAGSGRTAYTREQSWPSPQPWAAAPDLRRLDDAVAADELFAGRHAGRREAPPECSRPARSAAERR